MDWSFIVDNQRAIFMVYLPIFYVVLWFITACCCALTLEVRGLFFTGIFISAMKWSSTYAGLWDSSLSMMSFDILWVVLIYFNLPGKFGDRLLGLTAAMVAIDMVSYAFPDLFGDYHDYYRLNALNALYVLQCIVIVSCCGIYHHNKDVEKDDGNDALSHAREAFNVFGLGLGRWAKQVP